MLPASPMEWVDFNIFQVGFALRSGRGASTPHGNYRPGCMGCCDRTSAGIQRQGFMYTIWSFWMTLIWISDMTTLFHQLQFFQRYKQNGKQTRPRKDILSPVDERSRQLTSNSSLMGLESQCTNASKSTWYLFSPISLAFLQTCQVSNV